MSEHTTSFLTRRRLQAAGSLLALGTMTAACGSAQAIGDEHDVSSAKNHHSKYHVTFDYLNHGSKVIDVYPSPTNTTKSGTFLDGQAAPAYCKEEGREVESAPGETPHRTSNEWIKVMTYSSKNNTAYFATAVYIEHPNELLDKLPDC